MTFVERPRDLELPNSLKLWVDEAKQRWSSVPEFRVDAAKLSHLAIVCDGNRRAAVSRGLEPYWGHIVGMEVVTCVAKAARNWGIKNLTFWLWSTENWERENEQVEFVMYLGQLYLSNSELIQDLFNEKVRVVHLGRKDRLPKVLQIGISRLEEATSDFDRYVLNLAVDYGGRDEIHRMVSKVANLVQEGKLSVSDLALNPGLTDRFLDTGLQPDPDLVIRTGRTAEKGLSTSGFLPLQTSYSVWSFVGDLFPEVKPETILLELSKFQDIKRSFGK